MRGSLRTIEEINAKIKKGDAVVTTAEEFIQIVENRGLKVAAKEVDVVTTGTFGAMCSSGAFLNFGHAEPPIKMWHCWLNDVPAYRGLAAVDAYIGATAMSETKSYDYGGGHVIEDLVRGEEIQLRADAYGTDCYPRKSIETTITLDDLNQAVLLNPRNAYSRYNAATNSTDETLYTYMNTLLPRYGNITYAGAGQLSPLYKDINLETIGIGTRIFLGGGIGYVIGEGTQHNPQNQLGTIMVRGDLKQMKSQYLKGASIYRYGTSLFVGIGIPIPILNEKVAKSAALKDEDIVTDILDYGMPSRNRHVVKKVSYAELKSGKVTINEKNVPASPLTSLRVATEIADTLKKWIQGASFFLSQRVEPLPTHREVKPLKVRKVEPKVRDIMTRKAITAKPRDDIKRVATVLLQRGINHLPIVDEEDKLVGIVTSWDLAKALAFKKRTLKAIMTRKVVTAREEESIDVIARKMARHNISGVPVLDPENRVVGMVTAEDLSKKLVGRVG